MLTEISTSTRAPLASLEDQQQRVLQLAAVAVRRGLSTVAADDLLAEHPAHHVDVVHGGVGDRHVPGVMARHAGVAVRAVHHQRSADLTAVDDRLERPVGRVVPAHVADLDQPTTERDLGVDDPQAGLLRGRQRLLAEDGLAGRDRRQHVLLVASDPTSRRPPRRLRRRRSVPARSSDAARRAAPRRPSWPRRD